MLTEEHFDLFRKFRVRAMGERLREMVDDPAYDDMTFEDKVVELLEAEASARRERKIAKLNREAGFKLPAACVEDIVYLPDRKLSRDRVARYASCKWVEGNEVLVIISKTGCGKSYLCQALGNSACRHLHSVTYTRMADMFMELNRARAHADGSYFEKMDRRDGQAADRRRLHDDAHQHPGRRRPLRDHGGARGQAGDAHSLRSWSPRSGTCASRAS